MKDLDDLPRDPELLTVKSNGLCWGQADDLLWPMRKGHKTEHCKAGQFTQPQVTEFLSPRRKNFSPFGKNPSRHWL